MYYQYNKPNEMPLQFEPIRRKRNEAPFSQTVLRTIAIASACIGIALLTYSATFTSHSDQTTALNAIVTYSNLDNHTISDLFDEFKQTYNRTYATPDEEVLRYNNFRDFLYQVDQRNGNDSSAVHGITKFADLSPEEFKNTFLGYRPTQTNNAKIVSTPAYDGSETVVNWANIYTTAVKDQGYCGSCWAFSATEQIESDSIRLGLLTINDTLSPEQIVQCDSVDEGCNGGNTATAFEYVRTAGGIERDNEYPYTSYYDVTGTCHSNSSDYLVTVDEYYLITDESSMMSHIFSTGPISICLDASSWSSYVSGIITSCGDEVDHCVQAVGLNMDEGYWIVRNSWGTEWGNEGYIWLESGANMCNIAYDPKYVETVLV